MEIIPRTAWGAQHGRGGTIAEPVPLVVVHHSWRPALKPSASREEEVEAVRGVERFHVEANGWSGIGYNYLVAPSGRAYEGRGWGRKGAHAGPVNGQSWGVCLLIDGHTQQPTRAAIVAVRDLIRSGLAMGYIDRGYQVTGHRDHMARDCPGDLVYARIQEFRHDAAPPDPVPEIATPVYEPHPPTPLERK